MSAAMNWPVFQRRETVAQLGTVMAGLSILVLSQTMVLSREAPVQDEPISLTIVSPDVAPDKIIKQPEQVIQPPKPEKTVEPPREMIPVSNAPAPAPAQQQVAAPAAPVLPKETIEPVIAEPKVQRSSNSAAEGLFAQDVRARIERKKIYPDTARDLGMSGEVEVLYELDRTGNLIRAEIVSSSGFKLLDQAALKAVKQAAYTSFPEDAWVGANSKVFRTKLVFTINQ